MLSLRRVLRRTKDPVSATGPRWGAAAARAPGVWASAEELIRLRLDARGLRLANPHPIASALAGSHHSRFRGRGMDYQETRSYQPGDDIRNMDWRVTARAGRPHTKLYQEERERPVVVVVDLGPSMFFGTRNAFKSVVAVRAAALIGWATVGNGDRIGALLFNGTHHELAPKAGRPGVLRLIRQLVATSEPALGDGLQSQRGGLSEALQRLRRVARPGSLVAILSDFYSLDEVSGNHLSRLRRHNDVIAVQIFDPLEQAPPPPGRYGISDGGRRSVLDTRSRSQREAYAAYFVGHHRRVREDMAKWAIPLIGLRTDQDMVATLCLGLAARPRRRATVPEVAA